MTDLTDIRARHAAASSGRIPLKDLIQAHADRAALLAEVDALTRERDALNAVARRHLDAEAALDRLAAAMDAHCTGSHALEHCCVALLRERLGG